MKNELHQLVPEHVAPVDAFGRQILHCAVILPVGSHAPFLTDCLNNLALSAENSRTHGIKVDIYVLVNGRDIHLADIASGCACHLITTDAASNGEQRAIGARAAVSAGATWLAFTDAGVLVAENWLHDQIGCRADIVLGCVEVTNRYLTGSSQQVGNASFLRDSDSIDFANLGLSASTYTLVHNVADGVDGLDLNLLGKLPVLGLKLHHCDKPLVYRRADTTDLENADFSARQAASLWRTPAALAN